MKYRITNKSFHYRKAFAQPEKGYHTWRVIDQMVKHSDGRVTFRLYEQHLPKPRALRLSMFLNTCARLNIS